MSSNIPRITLVTLLTIFTVPSLYSQKNIVKARALGIPASFKVYTLSVGYERIFKNQHSIQVLLNKYGFDTRDTDGDAIITSSIIPEYRIYFGKNHNIGFNKSTFIGLFTELSVREKLPSGYPTEEERIFAKGIKKIISPGILVGKNFPISENWFFDTYIGVKQNFINDSRRYMENQLEIVEEHDYNKTGVRIGFNLGYIF